MSLDDPSPLAQGRAESSAALERGADGLWPIDPDPRFTSLPGRQRWRFADGRPVAAEVAGIRIAADDARIAHLGIRRDARGHPFPAAFAHAPETGGRLGPPVPAPDPDILDIDAESAAEVPLPSGVPVLVRAGHPATLYLYQENLGAFEVWDGRAFAAMGRLPIGSAGSGVAASRHGMAYTTSDALVSLPLPQLGPPLGHAEARAAGLRFLSAPCWRGAELLALGERDGRLSLCRGAAGSDSLDLRDLGRAAPGGRFAGPWTNRLGDAFWTGAEGFVSCRTIGDATSFSPWPPGFAAISAQAPWCDRADMHHQLGMVAGRYYVAALSPDPLLHRLDGPHLAAGSVTYSGAERFDVPWLAAAEVLNLGVHAGNLMVPLLAMPRDTVLLALDIAGPRGGFLRGESLPAPVTGHVLHHAHGAGLRRLPIGLAVSAIGDARALLHDGALYLWSCSERRCHALRLRMS
ncbi:hypothetical protein [Methylobacterium sp. NEAU K]|uniref:hypothetical protein n=1 Tax=Methylobacterium sp. NEAU K TaxID=3064946 RepID=UPI0027357F44|nr:hypothetical protein [Methylobacterium sp. NEAU K]MDP4003137.1 hypothetical protein [Methylobacterium sp. NEAU K]